MVVVKVLPSAPGAPFAYGPPTTLLFDAGKYSFTGRGYDVSRDGQKFLMVKPVDAGVAGRESLTIVTHWFEELRAAVERK